MTPEILYAENSFAVIVKPAGLLSTGEGDGTVPGALQNQLGTLYPVHRLDRVVGGVMVYARTPAAAAALSTAVAKGLLQKIYLAVVPDETPDHDEWQDYLFKDSAQNKVFVVPTPRKGAREAALYFRTLETAAQDGATLSKVRVTLLTGRSHQIRVQFASRGFPLVGDGKYGSRIKAPSPALWSEQLNFPHPITGRDLTFCAPPPAIFPFSLFSAPPEIEHKYLIRYPDVEWLCRQDGARTREMLQTYLTAAPGETRRVREVGEGGKTTFFYTCKARQSVLSAMEKEREITAEEYETLLAGRDMTRNDIRKTRYSFPYGGHLMEVDIYPFWQDRAILEVEVRGEEETVLLPRGLHVIREVSADKRYKNVNLAKEIPTDPLP